MKFLDAVAKLLDKAVEKFGMLAILVGAVVFYTWVVAECLALTK